MQQKYLIATSKAPIDDASAKEVASAIIEYAAKEGLGVVGIKGQAGPGCYNIALAFTPNENCEAFMMKIAQAFFPSRWCDCNDDDFTGVNFIDL